MNFFKKYDLPSPNFVENIILLSASKTFFEDLNISIDADCFHY